MRYAKMNVIVGFAICFVVTVVAGDEGAPIVTEETARLVKREDEDKINKTIVLRRDRFEDRTGVIVEEDANGWVRVRWPNPPYVPHWCHPRAQQLYYSVPDAGLPNRSKRGTCPNPIPSSFAIAIACGVDECQEDVDCPGSQKCCVATCNSKLCMPTHDDGDGATTPRTTTPPPTITSHDLEVKEVETTTQEPVAVTLTVVKSDDPDKLNKEVVPAPGFRGYRGLDGSKVGIIEIDYEDGWVAVRWLDTRQQEDHSVGDDGVFELYYAEEEKGCTKDIPCPIMGHMTEWSEWSTYSATCGMARRKRQRTCDLNTLPPARDCGEKTRDMEQIHHLGECPTQGRTTAKGEPCATDYHCGFHGRSSYSYCHTGWYGSTWDFCCTTSCVNGKCQSGTRHVDCTEQEYCRDCHKNAHCISRQCVCKEGFSGKHCQRRESRVSTETWKGSANATSTWKNEDRKYVAQKAFDRNPTSYWHPEEDISLPQTLYFKFRSKIQVTRLKLVAGGVNNRPDDYPRNFKFFGSNAEDCTFDDKWEYQKQIQDAEYIGNEFSTETSDNRHRYSCYGIQVEATRSQKNRTAIRTLEMFKSATPSRRRTSFCRCSNGQQDEHVHEKTLNEMPSNNALPHVCGTTATRRKRIVNGNAVRVLDHPWQVQLQRRESNRWKHLCGGTLIRNDTVLTAAHCFDSLRSGAYYKTDFRIITGQQLVLEEDNTEKNHTIRTIIVHGEYGNYGNYANDIALVKIASIGPGDFARPACLPNPLINDDYSKKNPRQRLVVSGYGTTEFGQQYATELRATEVDTIATDQCKREFRNNSDNSHVANDVDLSTNMCGKDSNATHGGLAKSECVGDSGGPVVTEKGGKYVLVGIVSWGQGCKDSNNHFPSVYTRVRCYLKWIHQKLGVHGYNECRTGRSNTSYTRRPGTRRSGASGSRGAGTGSSDSSDTQWVSGSMSST